MKVRRTLSLATGAALGAGAMWLLDPDSGRTRRRAAAREAWQRLRRAPQVEPVVALDEARRRSRDLAGRAREGFEGARRRGA